MKIVELKEQITHILTLNKFTPEEIKVIIKEINEILLSNYNEIKNILEQDLKLHGEEVDVEYELYKRKHTKNHYRKYLRHLFIAQYIEKLLKVLKGGI